MDVLAGAEVAAALVVAAAVAAEAVLTMAGVEVAAAPASEVVEEAVVVPAGTAVPGEPTGFSEGPGEARVSTRELESSPQADNSKPPIKKGISSKPGKLIFL